MDCRDGSLARSVSSLNRVPCIISNPLSELTMSVILLQNKYRTTASMRDDVISRTCATRPNSRRRCRLSLRETETLSTTGSAVLQTNRPWMIS